MDPDFPKTLQTTNWAGNITWSARDFAAPATLEQLQELVAGADRLRVVGSGHSFSDIADTAGTLISIAALPRVIEVDDDRSQVRVTAGVRYGELAVELAGHDLALPNLASLPHISVAGSIATGTHGSGVGNRSLSARVAGIELLTSAGEVVTLRKGDPRFDGAVVHLGSLGVVTAILLDVEPSFDVAVNVFDGLPFATVVEHFEAVMSDAYSVSVFTDWSQPLVGQVWLKRRADGPGSKILDQPWFTAPAATEARNPVPGVSGANAVEQFGVAGPWHQRLPHFRLGETPSSGAELQSEYFVDAADAPAALQALAGIAEKIHPTLMVCEVRRIADDELWLSPAGGRESAAFHFTWHPDLTAAQVALREIERVLAPFDARPHWGKVFTMERDRLAEVYPRLPEFRSLMTELDPRGAFQNAWTERHLRA